MVFASPHTCLTRFLPAACPEHVAVQIDPDGCLRKGQDSNKENNKRLDFSAWLMAWKRYAMGEHLSISLGDASFLQPVCQLRLC